MRGAVEKRKNTLAQKQKAKVATDAQARAASAAQTGGIAPPLPPPGPPPSAPPEKSFILPPPPGGTPAKKNDQARGPIQSAAGPSYFNHTAPKSNA